MKSSDNLHSDAVCRENRRQPTNSLTIDCILPGAAGACQNGELPPTYTLPIEFPIELLLISSIRTTKLIKLET